MWVGPCETLGKLWNTYPYLAAVAGHHSIWWRMGLRSSSDKGRCDTSGDLLEKTEGFTRFWALCSDLLCLAGPGKELFFNRLTHLFLTATLLGPYSGTQVSENQAVLPWSFPCKSSSEAGPAWPYLLIALESSSAERSGQLCFHLLFHLPLKPLTNTIPKDDFFLVEDPCSSFIFGLNIAVAATLVSELPLGLKLLHGASCFCASDWSSSVPQNTAQYM